MMNRRQHSLLTNRAVVRIAAALSLLWSGLGLFYLLDGVDGIGGIAARDALPVELLALAAPLLLVWIGVLVIVRLGEVRESALLFSSAVMEATHFEGGDKLLLEEMVARRKDALREWEKSLHASGEEIETSLRETTSALSRVLERSLERLGTHLDDSREQIEVLLRASNEQEASVSRSMAALRAEIEAVEEALRRLQERLGEIDEQVNERKN